jgi:hypothetical protein
VLWLLGFIGHFGGALIHLLLVIAVIVLVIQLIQGRRLWGNWVSFAASAIKRSGLSFWIVEGPRREIVSSSGSAGQSKALDLDIEHASRAGRSLCAVDGEEIFS